MKIPVTHRRAIAVQVLSCALLVAVVGLGAAAELPVRAASDAVTANAHSKMTAADLERAFWICDYTATMHGVSAAPIEICSAVTDELKQLQFSGDFMQMLKWWEQNKPHEHTRLGR
jgi:hypothetical protein